MLIKHCSDRFKEPKLPRPWSSWVVGVMIGFGSRVGGKKLHLVTGLVAANDCRSPTGADWILRNRKSGNVLHGTWIVMSFWKA